VLRRIALALLAIALLAVASVQPAQAAPPPTLTGERFFAQTPSPISSGAFNLVCRENADGTDTYTFTATGSTDAPYAGTFNETGEVNVRPDPSGLPHGDVLSAKAEFTIDSASGQVAGSKRLPAPIETGAPIASCSSTRNHSALELRSLALRYNATITTTSGVFADRGGASLNTAPTRVRLDDIIEHDFTERFTSDLAAPEQQGSILFGKRTPGASFSAMSANAKRAVAFPLYFPATVRKLHAFVDGRGGASGSQTLRGVLYAHGSGGAPGALLGRTFQFSVPAGMSGRWLELYLAPAIRLNPGVYWLGLHSGATNRVARFAWDPKDNSRHFNVDYYPDGPSNPFGSAALDNQQMSIFASGSY
jgi:hypothetical protein